MTGPQRADHFELSVMTFNLRRRFALNVRRHDAWRVRQHRVRELLRSTMPTILATQEVMPDQAQWVAQSLGVNYQRIGRGRQADGAGEGCPIFFNSALLDLEWWQQTALSDTPNEAGSRSWGNLFPRILVEAHFRHRVSSQRFRVINTHLDPFCTRSQVKSAHAVRSLVAAAATPAIVMGDLNAGPESRTVRSLLSRDLLQDAWRVARQRTSPEFATYAKYRQPRLGRRIDWILTTPHFVVNEVGILASRIDGGWPSDHLPVQATLTCQSTKEPA
jgi:endonuclease/exonuclease/phosphatase family metal-dependent hydrolase